MAAVTPSYLHEPLLHPLQLRVPQLHAVHLLAHCGHHTLPNGGVKHILQAQARSARVVRLPHNTGCTKCLTTSHTVIVASFVQASLLALAKVSRPDCKVRMKAERAHAAQAQLAVSAAEATPPASPSPAGSCAHSA